MSSSLQVPSGGFWKVCGSPGTRDPGLSARFQVTVQTSVIWGTHHSVCFRLVFKIWWREERALPLTAAVYQGHAFLLSVKGRAVIAGQGQVGSDAFSKAVTEKGLIHAKRVPGSLGVILQSASGKDGGRGREKREGHRTTENKKMREEIKGWLTLL